MPNVSIQVCYVVIWLKLSSYKLKWWFTLVISLAKGKPIRPPSRLSKPYDYTIIEMFNKYYSQYITENEDEEKSKNL